jgi:hypothetical protein
VSIKATSTPSCEVPLISPIARTDVEADVEAEAGESNVICSDIMRELDALTWIFRRTCYTSRAAAASRG